MGGRSSGVWGGVGSEVGNGKAGLEGDWGVRMSKMMVSTSSFSYASSKHPSKTHLTNRQVGGDEVLLLINRRDVGLVGLLANDL